MKTITLYRPVGLKEYELVLATGSRAFPPRLYWQPIFYPVLNQPYAEQIALDWRAKDEFSGFCGIVLAFNADADYCAQFPVQEVGGHIHRELWVPAESLDVFNQHIVTPIEVVSAFFGESFRMPENKQVAETLQPFIKLN